jgi:hypothetical protein
MTTGQKLFALLTWTDHRDASPDDVKIHAVYTTMEDVIARMSRIEQKNAAAGYPLRKLGSTLWRIGPDDDEGFFGNVTRYFRVVETTISPPPSITTAEGDRPHPWARSPSANTPDLTPQRA